VIAVLMAQAVYALVALNGSFFGRGLPACGCFFYHIPPSDLPADGNLSSWEPWFEGGKTLYRTPKGAAEDLEGGISFDLLGMRGLAAGLQCAVYNPPLQFAS